MGRRERPLDPAEGPVAQFAYELRKLRREAGGITYRAMARQAHYSAATLAHAAAGERLASLPVALAYAEACGGDRDEWERRWHQAAQDTAEESRAADDDTEAPYPGLTRFEASDSERFFGRDHLVGQLVDLAREKDFVVLTGPSGSGKSSLLRAGLIPRLQKTDPPRVRPATIRILTPGPHPARTHAEVLDPSTTRPGTVIVVDQFEELFTLCADPAERKGFLDLLFTAVRPDHGIRVVVAVRADFYGHCTRDRRLAQAAQDATLLVAPMSTEELRETIVKPAALGGLIVERTLTSRIIAEIQDEPGGLPLMSHALLETWRRRRGRALGEAAYDAAGGIHGAIARTAEDLYQSLTGRQADTARRILLRLVSPGQGTGDTRRPTRRTELTALGDGTDADTDVVLERLAHARLITLDEDTVDLAHEAVLTAWPRLRAWIDEDRGGSGPSTGSPRRRPPGRTSGGTRAPSTGACGCPPPRSSSAPRTISPRWNGSSSTQASTPAGVSGEAAGPVRSSCPSSSCSASSRHSSPGSRTGPASGDGSRRRPVGSSGSRRVCACPTRSRRCGSASPRGASPTFPRRVPRCSAPRHSGTRTCSPIPTAPTRPCGISAPTAAHSSASAPAR
ncbi:nSTAND1 domain-containing NTPase [Streptomyces phaeochromogenes]|uniref:nSTAND1 domain-containing NTPase n=1 Tax=Streptomyces phaeochromogenes TaxID=1923 RepID=UPI00340F1F38